MRHSLNLHDNSNRMQSSIFFNIFSGLQGFPRMFLVLWAVLVLAELLSFNFRLIALGSDFESAAAVALADSMLSYVKWGGIAVAVSYITKKYVDAMVTQMSSFFALLKTMSIWLIVMCFLLLTIALVASLFVPEGLDENFQLPKSWGTALAAAAAVVLYGSLPYAAVMYHQYVMNAVLIRRHKRTGGPRPSAAPGFVNGFKVPFVSMRNAWCVPAHFIIIGIMLACTALSSYLVVSGSPWIGAVLDSVQGVLFTLLMTAMLRQSKNASVVLSDE